MRRELMRKVLKVKYIGAAAFSYFLIGPLPLAFCGEPPPSGRDSAIAAALDGITDELVAGHIQYLQDLKSRYSYMPGSEEARDYARQILAGLGYSTRLHEFRGVCLKRSYWGDAGEAAWVFTAGSTFYNSADGGASWQRQFPLAPGRLYDAHFVDAAVGYAASAESTVAKTEDGGLTWRNLRVDEGAADILRSIFFINRDVGWTACTHGSSPRIYYTDDGGGSWAVQSLPDFGCPQIIAFGDAERGWAVPTWYDDKVIYRSEDGGARWTVQGFPVPPADVRSFVAIDGDAAWAAYGGPRLLHTKDGGKNWSYVETGSAVVLTAVSFPNAATGFAAGKGVVYKTEDGGRTWSPIPDAPEIFWGDAAFGDAEHGLLIDLFGREIYLTRDGGVRFEKINLRLDMFWGNVVAERRGSAAADEIVLLGAHYDSTSPRPADGAPGADANASGVSCVLAAATAFRSLGVGRTLRFVLFGGAEQSYAGSRAYVEECSVKDEKIVAAVVLDMVGYDEDRGSRDDAIIRVDGASIWLGDYVAAVGKLYGLELMFDYEIYGGQGDHCSFWEAKYEALGLFEGGPGTKPELVYPYYQTPDDTLDKLAVPLATLAAKAAAATVGHLARSEYIGVRDPVSAAREEPRPRRPFRVFPNPYNYSSGAGVTFDGISSPATVTVFDVAGRKVGRGDVAAGRENFVWQPGHDGRPLVPGLYIYRVAGNDQLEVGKLVVIGR
jgi:photosystem II stability/assembly factor-like uncharacterized protein